jgi:FtsH-binding integral membrane protein
MIWNILAVAFLSLFTFGALAIAGMEPWNDDQTFLNMIGKGLLNIVSLFGIILAILGVVVLFLKSAELVLQMISA